MSKSAWVPAAGAFAVALVLSDREIHFNIPNDLRSPGVLLVNALLATATAVGFAVREGSLTHWLDAHRCLRFGLWSAAVFRLVPPCLNEDVLYLKNCGTLDLPYVVLGAAIHAVLAVGLAFPYALPVLRLPTWSDGEGRLCVAVVLIFFVVAGIVRLWAESGWHSLFQF